MSHSATLVWGDHLLMGHGPMDELHEEFVELIALLQTAEDSELPSLLQAMQTHLQHHFAEEDQWMLSTGFPPRDCHIDEHAAVLKSVAEVRVKLAEGNVALCRDLTKALVDWFPGHATHLDSALAHWLSKQRFGGKPVVIRRNILPSAESH
ncbi:UNVERIFIED_CONTAM: hemerythrin domain-containing protein [Comamonas sp. A-3]|uniref:Hemerythrin domain-containing protein n=1 Tax=Comamonas thiooxydans TaxID=363952 RepID=A0AA42TTG6_9BURK|nr:hemerythrin domain-containing protein [Comamonas thiooxydans]MDH1333183.1 hemerythrin domain-containing protein [Comamonas thiooxydans]MDH1739044.1 hemerythrin domain-containing protein [Comamonas thiooxydans]MDH1786053.1 hemerythrin domain-containing protein [Comamonas thiooxydans]